MNTENPAPNCGFRTTRLEGGTRLYSILIGVAFVLNSYLVQFVYPGNPLVGDMGAMIGAMILSLPIFGAAVKDILKGSIRVNELVALAVLAAMALGDFRTAGLVAFFMLIAKVIETRTAEGAHTSIENLIRLAPTTARRLSDLGIEEEVPVTELATGDRIRVLPGESVPADGAIMSGKTTLNEASITGESMPADKGPGQEVHAATQNLTGAFEFRVTRIGKDTTIGRVRELILAAERTKLPIMLIIDNYIAYYAPVILMLAGLVWFFTDDGYRVISLLVISCPCALILATPTAMVAALSAAARLGILIKNVADLEAAGRIDAIIFDKTGTLTTGDLGVSRLAPREGISPSELLYAAASAQQLSNHPVALAVKHLAAEVALDLTKPDSLCEEPGQGVKATVGGDSILAGRASWLKACGIEDRRIDEAMMGVTESFSAVFVARSGDYLGWVGLQDQIRPEAKSTIQALRDLDISKIAMISGDREAVVKEVAKQVGCSNAKAECLPQEKVDYVHSVQKDGYHVAVIGDGVNDAPALAAGDTGIAMGAAGSDAAIHSASVALMSNDLERLPFLIRLSRSARSLIYQNVGIGLLFVVGGILLSGTGKLNPILAAFLHSMGSLMVILNSARLIREGEEMGISTPNLSGDKDDFSAGRLFEQPT